jgi:ketosteroid isomerase-like protein
MPIHTLKLVALVAGAVALLTSCAGSKPKSGTAPPPMVITEKPHTPTVKEQVLAAELAFAKTFSDRDFSAFARFLSRDAIFFSQSGVERGPAQIAAVWEPLFKDNVAPFSWTPDAVEVLGSGDLALSTGVVLVGGKVVGRFNSVWRLEAGHTWRVVFDKGEQICATPGP